MEPTAEVYEKIYINKTYCTVNTTWMPLKRHIQKKPDTSGEFNRLKKEIFHRLDISLAMFIRQEAAETDKKLMDEKTYDKGIYHCSCRLQFQPKIPKTG